MKYWALVLNNFKGQDETVYFENYEIAKKNFDVICEKYKNCEEFSIHKRLPMGDEFFIGEKFCEWYDPFYNEYSTIVYLREMEVNNEILF